MTKSDEDFYARGVRSFLRLAYAMLCGTMWRMSNASCKSNELSDFIVKLDLSFTTLATNETPR